MINDIPPMIYLACGPQGMMSISDRKRHIYAWGNNFYGQLGRPQSDRQLMSLARANMNDSPPPPGIQITQVNPGELNSHVQSF